MLVEREQCAIDDSGMTLYKTMFTRVAQKIIQGLIIT